MAKRSHGLRSKSRNILRKRMKDRSKSPVTRAMQEFTEGEKVSIDIDSAVHKGMPHIRFQGHTGEIKEKQGKCYVVAIKTGKKQKELVVRPEHLRRVE